MRALTHSIMILTAMLYAMTANADANDGDLFGSSLGERYSEQGNEEPGNGELLLIAASNPVKPTAVDRVYVLLTPISRSIGKIAGETWYESGEDALVEYERFRLILRDKYSHWESDEKAEQHFHVSNFVSGDYKLTLQVSGPHEGDQAGPYNRAFRFLLTLNFNPKTKAAIDFETMAKAEIDQSAAGRYSKEEVQGL